MSYRIIDVDQWNRKTSYQWFSSFSNPCYGFDVQLDVTELVKYSKETKTSFFINLLFIVMLSLNSVEELRLRYVDKEIRLYDVIHPTYTISMPDMNFENCGNQMNEDYHVFYQNAKAAIDEVKSGISKKKEFNSNSYDVYYLTCVPWLDYISMTHPLPDNNKESSSVPRACWGKYTLNNGHYLMPFNLTVSHALVDGYPAAKALNVLKENCLKAREFYC